MALRTNGQILVTGWTQGTRDTDLLVLALTPRGRLDPGFGNGGVFRYDSGQNDHGAALRVLSNGKVLLAGYRHNGRNSDALLLQLNPNGKLDSNFARGGVAVYDHGANEKAYAIEALNGGRIILAGLRRKGRQSTPLLLALDPSGNRITELDEPKGVDFQGYILAMMKLANGQLAMVGGVDRDMRTDAIYLGLGKEGVTIQRIPIPLDVNLDNSAQRVLATAVATQSNDQVIVTGWIGDHSTQLFILRLKP